MAKPSPRHRRRDRKVRPPSEPRPLTAKQRIFVAEYQKDHNATQAAKRAGYSGKTAEVIGYENLRKPQIADFVAAGHQRALAAAGLTTERTLEEIRRIALFDPIGVFDEHGNLLHVKDMSPEVRACIASVKILKVNTKSGDGIIDTVYEVKFWDKPKAVEMAAKHFSLLVEQIRLSGSLHHTIEEAGSDDELVAQIEAILAKARARTGSDVPPAV